MCYSRDIMLASLLLFCTSAAVTLADSTYIHLLSVNQKVGETEEPFKQELTSCSLEAAARIAMVQPNVRVIMHATDQDGWRKKDAELFKPIASYIDYHSMNLDWTFGDTPMAEWWQSGAYKEFRYTNVTLSDAARIVMVHKLGGLYIDSDIILLNPQLLNGTIKMALHYGDNGGGSDKLNNAAFLFPKGTEFTKAWMEAFMARCPKDLNYGQCGPDLIWQVYEDQCRAKKVLRECANIHIWQQDELAPVSWAKSAESSKEISQEQWEGFRDRGMKGFHWYGKVHHESCISIKSVIARTMAQGCPLVHSTLGKYWCETQQQ